MHERHITLPAGASAQSATAPSERLAGFAALLREHGLTVGVAEQQAMLQAAQLFGPLHERPLQAAWRAIACHSQREWQLWADVYERFWHPEKLRGGVKVDAVDGAAARAGLREGDVILTLDNTEITDVKQFLAVAGKAEKSRAVSVMVRRGEWVNYLVIRPGR